ncbi:MAG: ABC transporter permease [bacterium]|nr:ABC transporter permease [bacterium]
MTAITKTVSQTTAIVTDKSKGMPLWKQITMMTWRNLVIIRRTPASVIPGLIISVFFLFIYDASLSGASVFLLKPGQSYLAFILPVSLISASLSGSGVAGQYIVRDIENGYFDKLLLTPISRIALLSGPVLAGAIILAFQTALILFVATLMGLQPATGFMGYVAVLLFGVLLGTGFAGFAVSVALFTGSAAATSGASFAFFPLTFLTATFVPLDFLSGWLKTAAQLNPITYVLQANREILLNGWNWEAIGSGLIAVAILGLIPFGIALFSLRQRTTRK